MFGGTYFSFFTQNIAVCFVKCVNWPKIFPALQLSTDVLWFVIFRSFACAFEFPMNVWNLYGVDRFNRLINALPFAR